MRNEILQHARKNGYAVGAFNVNTYDEMVGITEAAVERNIPVILMASMSSVRFFGIKTFVKLVKALDEKYPVPVLSQLDHCTDQELLLVCAEAGFDYVMYDGSHLAYEQNVEISRSVGKRCHELGVALEVELGVIKGEEGPVRSEYSVYTDPEYVPDFVKRTQADSLAVSIGNAHGFYKGEPHLEFELLDRLVKASDVPLVLHGGTGIPGEDIRRAVGMGICKVNVGTEIRAAYLKSVKDYAKEHESNGDVRDFVKQLRQTIGVTAGKYMDNFSKS